MISNEDTARPVGAESTATPTHLPPPPPPTLPPPPPAPAPPAPPVAQAPVDMVFALLDNAQRYEPRVAAPEFPPQVRHYLLKVQRLSQETVETLTRLYQSKQAEIPGMPDIRALPDDAGPAVELLPGYSATEDGSWDGLMKRGAACLQHELDASNPYLPRWMSKSEDKLSPWLSDFGTISDTAKSKLTTLCRLSAPSRRGTWRDTVVYAPCDHMDYLEDLCMAVRRLQTFFVWDMGEGSEPGWRWGAALALLGGLGTSAVRVIFNGISNEEDLDHWVFCPDPELNDDIIKGHQVTGIPLGLIRCEWPRLQAILGDEVFMNSGVQYVPKVLLACLVMHILKHCRLSVTSDGARLVVAHRGVRNIFMLPPGALNQTFMTNANRGLCKDICYTLGLPPPGGNNPTWVNTAVQRVFSLLMPLVLCRSRPVGDDPTYLPAPSTYTETIKERNSHVKWTDTGISVRNVARCDMETGIVDKDVRVTGHETIMYDWPQSNANDIETLVLNWRSLLPDRVTPELGSDALFRLILNINTLGVPAGYKALLNSILTCDLGRRYLAGSAVGSRIGIEYPLCYILPMGHTMETTTNQGKTNLGRIIGGTFVPGLREIQMNMSSSAPTQRVLGLPLETFGTAIFDEFQIPSDPSHFMSSSGLQALATGGSSTPGRAGENAGDLRLRHPLVLVSKVAVAPEDIINRAFPTFMDVLTDETRATGKALDDLMTGTGYMLVRLSHLMWMKKTNFIERIRHLSTTSSPKLRFDGHFTVACEFGAREEIESYLVKAREQLKRQHAEAERSGLVDQVGQNLRFDPKWYFNACSDNTLDRLYQISTGLKLGQLTPDVALHEIVEDDRLRRFDTVLSSFRIKEYAALQLFVSGIGTGWSKPGFTLKYIPKDQSEVQKAGEPIAYITVERTKEAAPNATPA